MSAFVKAVTTALKGEPSVNSRIVGSEQVRMPWKPVSVFQVFCEYMDIGIGTATEQGLVVPVLRNTQDMSFAGVLWLLRSLITRAQSVSGRSASWAQRQGRAPLPSRTWSSG